MFVYTIQDIIGFILLGICGIAFLILYGLDKLYQKSNWFRRWYDKKYPRKVNRPR